MNRIHSEYTSARISQLLARIKDFYRMYAPNAFVAEWQQVLPATLSEISQLEELIGEALPADYQYFLLQNDLRHSFSGNFECLDGQQVGAAWQSMTDLLDNGVFDDGRIEHHIRHDFGNWQGGYIAKCWWNRKWLPVAEDSCGNMKCIDYAPGVNGRKYQIISMEVQDGQGPFISQYRSWTHYLEMHLQYLKNGQFEIHDWGIEIDEDRKPRP